MPEHEKILPIDEEDFRKELRKRQPEESDQEIRMGLLGSALLGHFGRILQLVANIFGIHDSHHSFIHTQCDETLPMIGLALVSR
ncbi:MAG: hypothetical protein ACSHYF_04600 [Verrucomicrobiaceae bacterium]